MTHPPNTCDLECGHRWAKLHPTCRHGKTISQAAAEIARDERERLTAITDLNRPDTGEGRY